MRNRPPRADREGFQHLVAEVGVGRAGIVLGLSETEAPLLPQEVAAARGGLFQSIHNATEIGKLHEIYVHLQALVGGEEVIAAGSDSVDGIGTAAASVAGPAVVMAAPPNLPELAGLLAPSTALAQAILAARSLENVHTAVVDDTVSSAAFVVSWHDPHKPVTLSLVSLSLRVITPASAAHLTIAGSSYVVIRVDSPEPGPWQLRVTAGDAKGPHGYSWGVDGESPVGLRLTPPAKPLGQTKLEVAVHLDDPADLARRARFAGHASVPTLSVDDLIVKRRDALRRIKLRTKPDTPTLDPNLTKLPLLDLQLAAKGEPSLFVSEAQKLDFSGRGTKRATYRPSVAGTTAIEAHVTGTTTGASGSPGSPVATCTADGGVTGRPGGRAVCWR